MTIKELMEMDPKALIKEKDKLMRYAQAIDFLFNKKIRDLEITEEDKLQLNKLE